jgi:hypothetical protein
MPRILLAVFLILVPLPALAWGAQGHEIVATIALQELSPQAKAQVTRLLGSPAMLIHEANWADEIRDRRRDTGPWHYVDIPLGAPGYLAMRDCPRGDCVVAQITAAQRVLTNPRQSSAARAEALRFLIHLVADIHQPLHAVDNDDRGGNQVRIYLQGGRTNLHQLWDTRVVEALGFDSARVALDIRRSISPPQRKFWQAGSAAAWATDSHLVARDQVYPAMQGRRSLRLPPTYVRDKMPVTRQQLAKAGVRLAWLLNTSLK